MMNVNNIFKTNITFVEYSRSGIVYYTYNLEEVNELKKLGWKYNQCDRGYRIIPPSISVCDITELKKVFQYQNSILNYAYFLYLKKLSKENKLCDFINLILTSKKLFYKNFEYHISSGPIIETEIKIEGIDSRIEQLKKDMIISFLESKEYKVLYEYAEKIIKKNNVLVPTNFNIENLPIEIKNFYRYIITLNDNVNKKFKMPEKTYNVDMSLLDKINYDVLLFVPNGCYKFLNLFINENNYKKVMFWEFHIDETKPSTHKIFEKEFKGKKILLVDSIYSGKTLLKLKKIIEDEGGYPILLGLYPKSKSVINILDYTLILNKLYNVKKLNLNEDIFEKIYVNTLKEG